MCHDSYTGLGHDRQRCYYRPSYFGLRTNMRKVFPSLAPERTSIENAASSGSPIRAKP